MDFAGCSVLRSISTVGRNLGVPVADEAAIELKRRRVLGVGSVRVQQSGKVGHVDLLLPGDQHDRPTADLEKIARQTPSRIITVGVVGSVSRDIRKERSVR